MTRINVVAIVIVIGNRGMPVAAGHREPVDRHEGVAPVAGGLKPGHGLASFGCDLALGRIGSPHHDKCLWIPRAQALEEMQVGVLEVRVQLVTRFPFFLRPECGRKIVGAERDHDDLRAPPAVFESHRVVQQDVRVRLRQGIARTSAVVAHDAAARDGIDLVVGAVAAGHLGTKGLRIVGGLPDVVGVAVTRRGDIAVADGVRVANEFDLAGSWWHR